MVNDSPRHTPATPSVPDDLLLIPLSDLRTPERPNAVSREFADDLEELVSISIPQELLRTKRSRERLRIESTADAAPFRQHSLYPSFRTPVQSVLVPRHDKLAGAVHEAPEGKWETIQTGVNPDRSQRGQADSTTGPHVSPSQQHRRSVTEPGLASIRKRSQSVQPPTPRAVSTSSRPGRAATSTKPSATREHLALPAPSASVRRLLTPSTATSTARLRSTPLSVPAKASSVREPYASRFRSNSTAQDSRGDPCIPSAPQRATRRTVRASSTSRIRGPSPSANSWAAATAQGEEDIAIPLPWTESLAPIMYRTAQGDVQYADITALEGTSAVIGTAETIERGAVTSQVSSGNQPRPQDQILPAVARRLEAERLAAEKVAVSQDHRQQCRMDPARAEAKGACCDADTPSGRTDANGDYSPEELPTPDSSPVQTLDQQSRRSRPRAEAVETRVALAAEPVFQIATPSLATVSGDRLMNSMPLGPSAMSQQAGQASLIEVSGSIASGRPASRQTRRQAQPDPASHTAYEVESQRSGCCTACIVS